MQTYLPYEDFAESAHALDSNTLKRQRTDAWKILTILRSGDKHTKEYNLPVVQMWIGYEGALILYGYSVCMTWKRRGKKDNMLANFKTALVRNVLLPYWLGNKEFHDSHKSALLKANPNMYLQFKWDVPYNLPLVWPSRSGEL